MDNAVASKLSFAGGIAVSDLWNQVKMQFKDFPAEIRNRIQADQQEVIEEAVLSERICSIEKATLALLEANVPKDQIITLLQKHWDLRRSEAKQFIEEAEDTNSCS
jgi:hypothetical protein